MVNDNIKELSLSSPIAIDAAAVTESNPKNVLVKMLATRLHNVKGRKVFILNPNNKGEYRNFADNVVYVKFWCRDEKFRFPISTDNGVTLIDFEEAETSENVKEVIERIANLVRCTSSGKAAIILDTFINAEDAAALVAVQSEDVAVALVADFTDKKIADLCSWESFSSELLNMGENDNEGEDNV